MDVLYEKLVERNARETTPFIPIYHAYTSQLKLTTDLEHKIQQLEQQLQHQQHHRSNDPASDSATTTDTSTPSMAALQSALKNETLLRDKLEHLEEKYASDLKTERDKLARSEEQAQALQTQLDAARESVQRWEQRFQESESSGKLSEQQAEGLKATIRELQQENDVLGQENQMLSERLVTEKTKIVDQMNELTEMVESLKSENEKLQKKAAAADSFLNVTPSGSNAALPPRRLLSDMGVVLPTEPKFKISAHRKEASCLRFDRCSGTVCTAGADGTVQLWNSATGGLQTTLYGSMGQGMTSCDIGDKLVVGGGTDKTCRVWDRKTARMVCSMVETQ